MSNVLPALVGTEYTASVVQQRDTDYLITVFRPFRSGEKDMFHAVLGHVPDELEIVGERYIKAYAQKKDLNRVVEDIIVQDTPSLVGTYTGKEDTA